MFNFGLKILSEREGGDQWFNTDMGKCRLGTCFCGEGELAVKTNVPRITLDSLAVLAGDLVLTFWTYTWAGSVLKARLSGCSDFFRWF